MNNNKSFPFYSGPKMAYGSWSWLQRTVSTLMGKGIGFQNYHAVIYVFKNW